MSDSSERETTPPDRVRRLTPRQRWAKKQAAKLARWEDDHPNPTPYHEWAAERCRREVQQALVPGQLLPTWRCTRRGKERVTALTIDDLAIAYWAVECVGEKGLSYGQLDCCYKVCDGHGRSNSAKCAALAALQALGLIFKTRNYHPGKHGNVYVIVTDQNRAYLRAPTPLRQRPEYLKKLEEQRSAPPQPLPENDNPWA